jgi:hypothetical protein
MRRKTERCRFHVFATPRKKSDAGLAIQIVGNSERKSRQAKDREIFRFRVCPVAVRGFDVGGQRQADLLDIRHGSITDSDALKLRARSC